ncbi:hypothetical protein P5V15_004331 [Pogonomyrmex californicus]
MEKIEYRAVIKFLHLKGNTPAQIKIELDAVYGDSVFREDIIYYKEIYPIARKMELSRIIGRKIVGQLFGTAVSPSWWSYMWLKGIATLFGVYIINQIFPHVCDNTF